MQCVCDCVSVYVNVSECMNVCIGLCECNWH